MEKYSGAANKGYNQNTVAHGEATVVHTEVGVVCGSSAVVRGLEGSYV